MDKETSITADLLAKLQTILPTTEYAPGKFYETNIGSFIKDWDERLYLDDSTDAVAWVEDFKADPKIDEEKRHFNHFRFQSKYGINIAAQKGDETIAFLRKAKADVYRCIGASEGFFNGKYGGDFVFLPGERGKDIEELGKKTGGIQIIIIADYLELPWQPDL